MMLGRRLPQESMIHRLIYELRGCAHCSCKTWSIALPAPMVRARWAQAYFDRRVREAHQEHVLITNAWKEGQSRPAVQVGCAGRLMNHGTQKE
jgi:hypothetical protein